MPENTKLKIIPIMKVITPYKIEPVVLYTYMPNLPKTANIKIDPKIMAITSLPIMHQKILMSYLQLF